jgi:hypothetical protein
LEFKAASGYAHLGKGKKMLHQRPSGASTLTNIHIRSNVNTNLQKSNKHHSVIQKNPNSPARKYFNTNNVHESNHTRYQLEQQNIDAQRTHQTEEDFNSNTSNTSNKNMSDRGVSLQTL